MRLAAVAKTPGEKRNDADCGLTVHHAQHIRVDRGDLARGGGSASEIDHDSDRGHDERDAHEGGLNRIGPGHSEESADKDVGDRRDRAEPERGGVGQMERVLEKPGAGHHAGGAVDREENENHGRGAHGEPVRLVFETLPEIIRERERVMRHLGVEAETRGDELPVQPRADRETDRDPGFADTGDVGCARDTHQEPAAHVGRAD